MYSRRRIPHFRLADRAGPAVIGAASQGRPAFEGRRAAQVPPSPEIPAARETARSRPRSLPNHRLSWLRPRQWPRRPRLPSSNDIERASKFTREPFLAEGEDAATVLAPGTPHRRAFDAAMAEIEAGAKVPSVAWRRTFSLLLGLERLLSEDEPTARRRRRALRPPGRRAVGHAHRAATPRRSATATAAATAPSPRARSCSRPSASPARRSYDEDEPDEPQDWDEAAGRRRRRAARARRPRTRTPASASGSSTPPAPARRSPRSASSRRRAPAVSSS